MKNGGLISLESVIIDYLEQSEQSNSKYAKCFNLAVRGMDALGLQVFYSIKSVKLPVRNNKTVELPSDYVKYTKIGVFNERGEVISLRYNENASVFAANLPDREAKVEDTTLADLTDFANGSFFFNFWNAGVFRPMYGIPSGGRNIGNFKVSERDNVIVLNPDFAYDYIVLEYKHAANPDETYYVPLIFREALVAWIAWKDNELAPKARKVPTSNQERKSNYFNERRLAIAMYNPMDLQQAYLWNMENQRMTVKI